MAKSKSKMSPPTWGSRIGVCSPRRQSTCVPMTAASTVPYLDASRHTTQRRNSSRQSHPRTTAIQLGNTLTKHQSNTLVAVSGATPCLFCPRTSREHGQDARAASHIHDNLTRDEVFVVLDGVHIAHRPHLRTHEHDRPCTAQKVRVGTNTILLLKHAHT